MFSEKLEKARKYEAEKMTEVSAEERPDFHVTGGIGWINDPNGFSVYKGEYHLFYQYHPYTTQWGPMHWGHVKTKDFVKWERLPVAIAPDEKFDEKGCFSGSAIELPDGKQLLMYTGVSETINKSGEKIDVQQQCIAIGDGTNYEKYENNPVIDGAMLPAGGNRYDFRDPKIWKENEKYYAVIATRMEDGSGAILKYESEDGLHWNYVLTIDRSANELGRMWECPDYFALDNKQVLIVSPQEIPASDLEFHAGNGTAFILGEEQESGEFVRESIKAIDYGIDFYAPQTLETLDGRRVMIGWMQNWTTSNCQKPGQKYFGEMTFPRELFVKNGCVCQKPVEEIESYRCNKVTYRSVKVNGEVILPEVSGRVIDMTVKVKAAETEKFSNFTVDIAKDDKFTTTVRYERDRQILCIDRSRCGFPNDIVHMREFKVQEKDGVITLRFLMDKHSLELFVNDGEQAATMMLYTELSATGISFTADGNALMDLEKYDLKFEE